uniref:Secreted protein n=1 Tax=Lotharella globosa TaxID=91324 RepID=A0A7S4DNK3_9EUKA
MLLLLLLLLLLAGLDVSHGLLDDVDGLGVFDGSGHGHLFAVDEAADVLAEDLAAPRFGEGRDDGAAAKRGDGPHLGTHLRLDLFQDLSTPAFTSLLLVFAENDKSNRHLSFDRIRSTDYRCVVHRWVSLYHRFNLSAGETVSSHI